MLYSESVILEHRRCSWNAVPSLYTICIHAFATKKMMLCNQSFVIQKCPGHPPGFETDILLLLWPLLKNHRETVRSSMWLIYQYIRYDLQITTSNHEFISNMVMGHMGYFTTMRKKISFQKSHLPSSNWSPLLGEGFTPASVHSWNKSRFVELWKSFRVGGTAVLIFFGGWCGEFSDVVPGGIMFLKSTRP